jgi:2-keto-4-pentenoate hydratase/2-oxohepta-3-ene-1,7-dioic acid hydratase in catechol pathway
MAKYVRFKDIQGIDKWGMVNPDGAFFMELEGDPFGAFTVTSKAVDPDGVKILPPCQPSKIVAVGLNYLGHAKEMGMKIPEEPVLFIKPATALIGHMDNIYYPKQTQNLHYEAELAVIIKNDIKDITETEVDANVLGYTCFNDVTARDLQSKDGQWTRAKSFDTFAPAGPYVVTAIEPDKLKIKLLLNNELKQESTTADFIFKTRQVISFISSVMTLKRGDLVTTGTPHGIGPMNRGDRVEVEIEGIGKLTNFVE